MSKLADELQAAAINTLLDVRETAWSRKPGFSKSQLSTALSEIGVEYIHIPFAGNPRKFRQQARSQEECLSLYAAHLERSPEVLREFDRLVKQLFHSGRRVCLLCYERKPEDCHRSVLLAKWREAAQASVSICHITGNGGA